jgi:hypothetical protein
LVAVGQRQGRKLDGVGISAGDLVAAEAVVAVEFDGASRHASVGVG